MGADVAEARVDAAERRVAAISESVSAESARAESVSTEVSAEVNTLHLKLEDPVHEVKAAPGPVPCCGAGLREPANAGTRLRLQPQLRPPSQQSWLWKVKTTRVGAHVGRSVKRRYAKLA